ncbi:MAG: hypothetical protein KDE48_24470 [Anaerolineales bacterium]|nr:hypothetical protein [Anaerolineales bacterium]
MISKNGVIVIAGESLIYPLLKEDVFLESSLSRNAEKDIFNAGYHTYRAIGALEDELECVMFVTFYHGVLNMIRLGPRWPGLTGLGWDNWSEENELAIKKLNDQWLESYLGSPPYQYKWGKIESEFDAKTGGSDITITYFQ